MIIIHHHDFIWISETDKEIDIRCLREKTIKWLPFRS